MYTLENLSTRQITRSRLMGRITLLSMLVAALLLVTPVFKAEAQTAATSQLTITINSQGMTPASATVSTGIIHLKVKNQTDSDRLTLRVSRDSGELVREISVTEKDERAIELELSTAGQYVIT